MKTTFSIKFALPFTFQMELFSRENTVGKTGFKANQLYTLPLLFSFRVMYNIDSIYSVAWWTSLKSPCKLFAYHYALHTKLYMLLTTSNFYKVVLIVKRLVTVNCESEKVTALSF